MLWFICEEFVFRENAYLNIRLFSLHVPCLNVILSYRYIVGKRVHHVFQKTAWILAVIVVIMFRGAIARQWTLSKKNAGKAVGYAR